ncbi:hypothetical protein ZHAS_00007304 [Anopheles sinensis]|uniref:Uncharacterized protein n=1 Tax=Anopheles sinensis TaxID=74873 RepID=A0A084VPN0_ANOSI|nr:hypothetical protein ZHAS_00007304 [Anopheles sinensis]
MVHHRKAQDMKGHLVSARKKRQVRAEPVDRSIELERQQANANFEPAAREVIRAIEHDLRAPCLS